MKKYKVKKWPWWKIFAKNIHGIMKEYWIRDIGGKIVSGTIDEYGDLFTEQADGWIVPRGYYKEVKK